MANLPSPFLRGKLQVRPALKILKKMALVAQTESDFPAELGDDDRVEKVAGADRSAGEFDRTFDRGDCAGEEADAFACQSVRQTQFHQ